MITDKLPKQYQGTLLTDVDKTLEVMDQDVDLQKQMTASMTYMLDDEEKNLGITAQTANTSMRQEIVRAKWLSQFDVTGLDDIKRVANAYSNGEVDVAYSYPTLTITFVSTLGKPRNLTALEHNLRQITPAHLGLNFVFIYREHQELSKYTHEQLHAFTHENIRKGTM